MRIRFKTLPQLMTFLFFGCLGFLNEIIESKISKTWRQSVNSLMHTNDSAFLLLNLIKFLFIVWGETPYVLIILK